MWCPVFPAFTEADDDSIERAKPVAKFGPINFKLQQNCLSLSPILIWKAEFI